MIELPRRRRCVKLSLPSRRAVSEGDNHAVRVDASLAERRRRLPDVRARGSEMCRHLSLRRFRRGRGVLKRGPPSDEHHQAGSQPDDRQGDRHDCQKID